MSNLTLGVYRSRFGYHPCSRETAKKFRTINRVYMKALRMQAAWERWNNKLPENRKGKEPARCTTPAGREKGIRKDGGGLLFEWTYKWPGNGKRPYRISKLGEDFLEMSRQARKPQPSPEAVTPLKYSEAQIDRLYDLCVAFEESE